MSNANKPTTAPVMEPTPVADATAAVATDDDVFVVARIDEQTDRYRCAARTLSSARLELRRVAQQEFRARLEHHTILFGIPAERWSVLTHSDYADVRAGTALHPLQHYFVEGFVLAVGDEKGESIDLLALDTVHEFRWWSLGYVRVDKPRVCASYGIERMSRQDAIARNIAGAQRTTPRERHPNAAPASVLPGPADATASKSYSMFGALIQDSELIRALSVRRTQMAESQQETAVAVVSVPV